MVPLFVIKVIISPPPPKIQAIGKQNAAPKQVELTEEEKAALELKKERAIGRRQAGLLAVGGLFMLLIGAMPGQLYATFYCICSILFCRISSDLER